MELRTNKPIKIKAKTTRKREELEAGNFSRVNSTIETAGNNTNFSVEANDSKFDNNFTKSPSLSLEETSIKPKSKPKKVNIHKNHRSRLKEQYLKHGLTSLTDIQKLELLLFFSIPQKDTNPLAHTLLSNYGSIKNIFAAGFKDIIKHDGIKDSSALLIKLVNDFSNYINLPDNSFGYINSTAEARAFCSKFYHNIDVEQFYVVCLSKANRIKKFAMIKGGEIDEVKVPIREITQLALEQNCTRIIICHNHPFGPCNASNEDVNFTYSLMCSCLLNNIEILDHIIIGVNGSYSFNDFGIMDLLLKKANKVIVIQKETQLSISESRKKYIISNPQPTPNFEIN